MSYGAAVGFVTILLLFSSLSLSNSMSVKAVKGFDRRAKEEQWLADRNLFLDIDNARSDTIDNITDAFLSITKRLVKTGHLMIETKRRLMVFTNEVGDMSYDSKWAMLGWLAAMFLFPIITAAVVAVIIALFFQNELTNLQIFLHTRWDVDDKPDIITECKAKQRLGNLAMQRLYLKMSRHPERFLPKQAKRDPEALIREKTELTQLNEASHAEAHVPGPVGTLLPA
ncbi:putative integral membrane protein [Acanthocheilonema viteae]